MGEKDDMDEHERKLKAKIPGKDTGIEVRKSVCAICDPTTQCGLDLYVKDGRIIKVEGSKENPHNAGTLCSKGAATRQYVYHEDRLRTPLKRVGPRGSGEYAAISWDEALQEVVANLQRLKAESGPESVVFYVGYPKQMRPFVQRLAHQFGSPNFCTESSTCFTATAMAFRLLYGQAAAPDVPNARCLLVWSANPFHSRTGAARGLLDAVDRGMKLIVVDPRRTHLASRADLHLQLRPGTDGALALGMANVILAEGLYDREFMAEHAHGFAEYRAYVAQFDPARVAQITGVPAEKIQAAARLYATTKPAALMPSAAPVVHNTNGVQNYRAVFALIGLTGNFDVAGGNRVAPYSWLEVAGAGFVTRQHEFESPRSWEDMAPRVGADRFPVWSELVDQAQSMDLPRQIVTGDPYPLRGMVAFGLNYRMFPGSPRFLEALQRLDFICDIDLFATDSSHHADIVLPAASSVERSELRCYGEKYLLFTQPAIEPVGEDRSDTDIVFHLARGLGLDDPLLNPPTGNGARPAEAFEAALDWIFEPSGLTTAQLKPHPGGLPVPHPLPNAERKYREKGFPTPTGKMELSSTILQKHAAALGIDALPTYRPPKHSAEATPDLAREYPFILNTGSRLPMYVHSRTYRLPWTRSLRPRPTADINPADALRLGIGHDDEIEIATPTGAIRVRANLSELGQPGVVHMYHGCPEADVNSLLDPDYLDPISGFPGFKALLCSVRKVDGAPRSAATGAAPASQATGNSAADPSRGGREVRP
jgi:anaerobic selenocysteine-containing dehydrogenase